MMKIMKECKYHPILIIIICSNVLIAQNKDVNYDLRIKANEAYREGRIYDCVSLLNEALHKDTTDALAYFNLANAYLSVPYKERAIKNFERALKYDPTIKDLILNQFFVYTNYESTLRKHIRIIDIILSSETESANIKLDSFFNQDSLKIELKNLIWDNFSIEHYVDYLIWYPTNLAQKMAGNPNAVINNSTEISNIEERIALLKTIDEINQISKSKIKLINNYFKLILKSNSDDKNVNTEEIYLDTEIERLLKQQTRINLENEYRYLSNNDLKKLIKFYKSNLGIWLNSLSIKISKDIIQQKLNDYFLTEIAPNK